MECNIFQAHPPPSGRIPQVISSIILLTSQPLCSFTHLSNPSGKWETLQTSDYWSIFSTTQYSTWIFKMHMYNYIYIDSIHTEAIYIYRLYIYIYIYTIYIYRDYIYSSCVCVCAFPRHGAMILPQLPGFDPRGHGGRCGLAIGLKPWRCALSNPVFFRRFQWRSWCIWIIPGVMDAYFGIWPL